MTANIEWGAVADWVSGIGSLIAVAVALQSFRVVDKQRAADRRDHERSVGYDLVAALSDIGNHVKHLGKHLVAHRNDITVTNGAGEATRFRAFNPLIGLTTEGDVIIPAGATELLVRAEAVELWNDILLLARKNRALTASMKEYRAVWDSTMAKMPTPFEFDGTVGHISAGRDDFANVRPNLIMLDSLVGALEEHIAEAETLVGSVAERIGPTLKAYFKEPFLHLSDKD